MSADVFLSHKSTDKPRLQALLTSLQTAGLTVWWDADTPGGQGWRRTIETELDAARCVLVCWSHTSITAPWVLEEAERAKARGVLLPVLMDRVTPPFGFAEIQTLDLVGWQGNTTDPRWQRLLASVQAILEGKTPPQLPPQPPPNPWPRRLLLAGVALTATAALWFTQRPDPADTAAWQTLAQAAPNSLHRSDFQRYLARFPQGAHAQEARQRLAACRDQPETHWQRQDDTLPLTLPSQHAATEAQARAALQAALPAAAADTCAPYAKNPEQHRLLGARADAAGIHCQARTPGDWRCGFDGHVTCELEKRSTTLREICP